MQAGVSDNGIVIGTGPYVATELVTDDHVNLVKNENYWNGDVNVDEITVRTISDGDTLAMALQAGRSMLPMVWHMQAIPYLKMMILHLPVQLQAVHSMRG